MSTFFLLFVTCFGKTNFERQYLRIYILYRSGFLQKVHSSSHHFFWKTSSKISLSWGFCRKQFWSQKHSATRWHFRLQDFATLSDTSQLAEPMRYIAYTTSNESPYVEKKFPQPKNCPKIEVLIHTKTYASCVCHACRSELNLRPVFNGKDPQRGRK